MKDLWKVLFTGAMCLLVLGGISAIGFIVRDDYPWISTATIVTDCGIIFGGYKVIVDTIKAANDLRKTGLEVEKLRLEITEKKVAAEKAGAYVVVATSGEIEKYATSKLSASNFRRANWVRGGAAFLLVAAASATITSVWKNYVFSDIKQVLSERTSGDGSPSIEGVEGVQGEIRIEGSVHPKTICGSGTLEIEPAGSVSFADKISHETQLRFVLSNNGATLIIPLRLSGVSPTGEMVFKGINSDVPIPTAGAIEIDNTKGEMVTVCRFAQEPHIHSPVQRLSPRPSPSEHSPKPTEPPPHPMP